MSSARRILELHRVVVRDFSQARGNCLSVWRQVFSSLSGGDEFDEEAATVLLQLLRAELDLLAVRLAEHGCRPALYDSALSRLRGLAAPTQAGAGWASLIGNVTPPEVGLALEWAAWALPPDEDADTSEVAGGIEQKLRTLEEALGSVGFSATLEELLKRQLKVIRMALRQVPIRGTEAVAEALEQTAGTLMRRRSTLESEIKTATPSAAGWLSAYRDQLDQAAILCEGAEMVRLGLESAEASFTGMRSIWQSLPPIEDSRDTQGSA